MTDNLSEIRSTSAEKLIANYGSINSHNSNVSRQLTSHESSDDENSYLLSPPKFCLGIRHLVAFLGFLGFAMVYAMRVNLSVAIVSMVNSTAIPHANTPKSNECTVSTNSTDDDSKDGEFVWTESAQGLILGSFFWGYILTNFLGGRLGEMFGGRLVMGIGVALTSVFTLLSPVVARLNETAFIILRVFEGLSEGVTFPSFACLLARWFPPFERSQTVAMVFAGGMFGTVISLPLSGYLCSIDFLGGWPSVFYVFGAAGLIWSIFWIVLVTDGPEQHPWISRDESEYICRSLNVTTSQAYKALPVPWKSILTSLPFYAILFAHIGHNWCFYTFLTELPTYMANILLFDIKQNALISALPYFVMWVACLVAGFSADRLRSSGLLSTTVVRKIYNSIGAFGPAICLVAVGFTGCNSTLAVFVLTLGVGLNGFAMAGFNSSHLDISPNFAGTLLGITNTVATVPGFLCPIVVGNLVNGNETMERWQLVFAIAAVIICVGNIFYLIFFIGEPQHWNEPSLESESPAAPHSCVTDPASGHYQEGFNERNFLSNLE